MKKGQHRRKWSKEQKLEIVRKHLNEHISIKQLGRERKGRNRG
ncbi:MAG: transposase [Oscillospiraceae bacterium]|nr:transposase [Oscillospiraceae bacterium]